MEDILKVFWCLDEAMQQADRGVASTPTAKRSYITIAGGRSRALPPKPTAIEKVETKFREGDVVGIHVSKNISVRVRRVCNTMLLR